ncbi:MAG: hypothetical protein ACLP9L_24710 [Thermoguttaceae bacterium]
MIEWGNVAQWTGAVATLLAVLVALFKEDIASFRRKPKLRLTARVAPPDTHKLPCFFGNPSNSVDVYFLRVWIQNEGSARAEKVQVFVAGLCRKAATGTFSVVDSFLPMNLRWTHASDSPSGVEIFAEGISPGMGKHCDLARVVDPRGQAEFGDDHPRAKPGQTVLALATEVQPTNKSYLLVPGTYRLELRVAGANCRPRSFTVELTLTGQWYAEEEQMYRDGLGLSLVA